MIHGHHDVIVTSLSSNLCPTMPRLNKSILQNDYRLHPSKISRLATSIWHESQFWLFSLHTSTTSRIMIGFSKEMMIRICLLIIWKYFSVTKIQQNRWHMDTISRWVKWKRCKLNLWLERCSNRIEQLSDAIVHFRYLYPKDIQQVVQAMSLVERHYNVFIRHIMNLHRNVLKMVVMKMSK